MCACVAQDPVTVSVCGSMESRPRGGDGAGLGRFFLLLFNCLLFWISGLDFFFHEGVGWGLSHRLARWGPGLGPNFRACCSGDLFRNQKFTVWWPILVTLYIWIYRTYYKYIYIIPTGWREAVHLTLLWLWMDTSSTCCNVALTQRWERPESASTRQKLAMTPIKE